MQHSVAPSFCFHLEEGEEKECSFLPMYTGCKCSTRRAEGHVEGLVNPLWMFRLLLFFCFLFFFWGGGGGLPPLLLSSAALYK